MGSGYNLDPAKIGQEGYNLLKYYEQQLKALQVRNNFYRNITTEGGFENMIWYVRGSGRFKHEPNEAVKRFQGGVEREEQGGQEGGQGEAEGDVNGVNGDHY